MKIFKIKSNFTNFNLSSYKFNKEKYFLIRSDTLPYDDAWMESNYSVFKVKEKHDKLSRMSFDIGDQELVSNYFRGNLLNNQKHFLPEDFRLIYSKTNSSFDCLATASKLSYASDGSRRFIPGIFKINFEKNTIIEDLRWNHLIKEFCTNIFEKNWSFCFDKSMNLIIIKSIDPFKAYIINHNFSAVKELKFEGTFNKVMSSHYRDINFSLSGNLIRINHNNYYQLIKSKDKNNYYTYFLVLLEYNEGTFILKSKTRNIFSGNKLFICSIEKNRDKLCFYGGAFDRYPVYDELYIDELFK